MHVTRADVDLNNADGVVKKSTETGQPGNPDGGFDRILHCLTNLYFPLLADQDLAPF